MTRALLRHLRRDARGVTAIEFAIVAPVMALAMMGLGDMLHQTYAQSILNGAIQKAARDSSIQGGAELASVIDERVMAMVRNIAPNATYVSSRKSYSSFVRIGPEPFVDSAPLNGVRDPGECFDDVNANGSWDADPGRTGQGGANDVTLYKITVTYPRPFPLAKFLGQSGDQTIWAQTLLKNQPYASQVVAAVANICS